MPSSFAPTLDRAPAESFAATLVPSSGARSHRDTLHAQPEQPAEPEGATEAGITAEQLEAAVAEACARGRAAAAAEAQAQLDEMTVRVRLADELAAALDAAAVEQASQAQALFGELLLGTLGRIVGELSVFHDLALTESFNQIAGRMVGEREVVVRVSPGQLELAESLVADRPGWTVRKDANITAGVRVETERGRLDATLEAAMEGLEAAVAAWQDEQS